MPITHLKTQPTPTAIIIEVPAATLTLLALPSPRRFPILMYHHNPRHLWYGEEEAGERAAQNTRGINRCDLLP